MDQATRICAACPGGPRELPDNAFGVDRSRPDGRARYCRTCTARRAQELRASWRAGRDRRRRSDARHSSRRPSVRPSRTTGLGLKTVRDLILEAIDRCRGCSQDLLLEFICSRLYPEFSRATIEEAIGDALGQLFDRRIIATSGEAAARIYFRRRIA